MDNPTLGVIYAKVLNELGNYKKAAKVLSKIIFLPKEVSNEPHILYEIAYIGQALKFIRKKRWFKAIVLLEKSKNWPKNLGSGKPYRYDYRIQDYLIRFAQNKIGNTELVKIVEDNILSYRKSREQLSELNNLSTFFEYKLMKEMEMDEEIEVLKANLIKIKEKEAINQLGPTGEPSTLEWLNLKINERLDNVEDIDEWNQFFKTNMTKKAALFFEILDEIEKSDER